MIPGNIIMLDSIVIEIIIRIISKDGIIRITRIVMILIKMTIIIRIVVIPIQNKMKIIHIK